MFLIWRELTEEQKDKILETLWRTWKINPPILGKPPKGSPEPVERLYQIEIVALQEQLEQEKLDYNVLVNTLSDLVSKIEEQDTFIEKVKAGEKEEIKDLISLFKGELGEYDYRSNLTEQVLALQNVVDEQKRDLKSLLDLQQNESIKLLVKEVISLQLRLIREQSKKEANQDIIKTLKEALNNKSGELMSSLDTVEKLTDENKELVGELKELTEKHQDELLDIKKENLESRNELITKHTKEIQEKESTINDLEILLEVARSMYELLPESAQTIINEFNDMDIDLANPSRETIQKLYGKYAELRLELKDEFEQIKDKAIKELTKKYYTAESILLSVEENLNLINKTLMQKNLTEDYIAQYEDLKTRFKTLSHELDLSRGEKQTIFFDVLDSSIKALNKQVRTFMEDVLTAKEKLPEEFIKLEEEVDDKTQENEKIPDSEENFWVDRDIVF